MSHVKPPSADGRLAYLHLFGSGVGRAETGKNIIDLARPRLFVGSHVELCGLGLTVPRVKCHKSVSLGEDPKRVGVQRVRTHVKWGITGGTAYVRCLGPKFGLEIPSNNEGCSHRYTTNGAAEFIQKSLAFVPQHVRVAVEVMGVLIAIVDLHPPLLGSQLNPKDPARDNLFVPNAVRVEPGVEEC